MLEMPENWPNRQNEWIEAIALHCIALRCIPRLRLEFKSEFRSEIWKFYESPFGCLSLSLSVSASHYLSMARVDSLLLLLLLLTSRQVACNPTHLDAISSQSHLSSSFIVSHRIDSLLITQQQQQQQHITLHCIALHYVTQHNIT